MTRAAILPALLLVTALARGGDPSKAPKATVEAVGVSVSKKVEEDEKKGYLLRGANTSVTLLIHVPGRQVLAIDPASKVTTFKDDKGKDIKSELFPPRFDSYLFSFSKDKSKTMTNVGVMAAPTPGSTKILVKGELVLFVGSETKEVEKEVAFKKGETAKIGDFTLRVEDETGFGGTGGPRFVVESAAPVMEKIIVESADGKDQQAVSFPGHDPKRGWLYTGSVQNKLDRGKGKIRYYSKHEKLAVPVDLSAGTGL